MNTILSTNSIVFWLTMAGLWLNGVAFGCFFWVLFNKLQKRWERKALKEMRDSFELDRKGKQ
jgi:Trk-type K+ transport system membrane component